MLMPFWSPRLPDVEKPFSPPNPAPPDRPRTTPGLRRANSRKFRLLVGRPSISRWLIVTACCVWVTSISGASPVTVTDSLSVATDMPSSMLASDATVTMTRLRVVENPASSALTSYSAGGSATRRNTPSASVTLDRWNPVARFVAVTVTPGSTALVWSTTRPMMLPSAAP